jgi:hypothetical protein
MNRPGKGPGRYNSPSRREDRLTLSDEDVARELDCIRREARDRADAEGRTAFAPPPAPAPVVVRPAPAPEPAAPTLPAPPDAAPVNDAWRAEPAGGGVVRRWLERALRPRLDAQVAFNARQAQLDNALLEWLLARFAATHEHYDRLHHAATRRMNDIDERHLLLQEHLVVHVHELVRRIDFVLEASERSRLSAEAEMKRLAARVEELEKRLGSR